MVFFRLLELSGDAGFNPGPKPDSSQKLFNLSLEPQ